MQVGDETLFPAGVNLNLSQSHLANVVAKDRAHAIYAIHVTRILVPPFDKSPETTD